MSKFGMKVPHGPTSDATRTPVSRSKRKVTRPINADVHPAAYLNSECELAAYRWLLLSGVFVAGVLRPPRGLCGLEAKLFGLGLVVSGLMESGLVASNITLINIYNRVIDVQRHLLEKLVFLKCNDC